MKPLFISATVDCRVFREYVYHFQADELAGPDRDRLQEHVDSCDGCARYLEVEGSFLRALKGRLRSEKPRAGLETRIRDVLEREAPTPGRHAGSRVRWPAVSALAAALLLVALMVPSLRTVPLVEALPGAEAMRVVKSVTIVDGDCDAAGRTWDEQKACRDARHLNVLKVSDGMYWNVNLDNPVARDIVLERENRGRRIVVEADLYPALQTVHLIRVQEPSATGL